MRRGCQARAGADLIYGPCWQTAGEKNSSKLHAVLEHALQASGKNGKPIIGPIGKHIALSIK